jgi:hypothetical protein
VGDGVVSRLASDLRAAFPEMRGFSAANLWRMHQFYSVHTAADFLAQAARELGPAPNAESPQPKVLRSSRAEVADARRAAEPKTVAARDGLLHWRPKGTVPADFLAQAVRDC